MEEIASHVIPENKWDLENGIDVYLIALRVSLPKKLIWNEFCVSKWCLLTVSGSDLFSGKCIMGSRKERGNFYFCLNVAAVI